MRFTASTSDLQRALSKLGSVVPAKSTVPILESILFDLFSDTLTLTATDMEISLTLSIDVKGEEDGRIVVPAKRLMDTVRSLSEKSMPVFAADTTSNKITLTTANGEYGLVGESAKEFPAVQQPKGEQEIRLPAATMKRIIHRTAFAVSSDELRPAMMGVLLQPKGSELRAVATDGHRLVRMVQKIPGALSLKRDVIVPAKALHVIAKSADGGEISMTVGDSHIVFAFDRTVLVSRLIDETYPSYESVIPSDNDKTLVVNREATISSIRRVSLYATASTHQVRFDVAKGGLTLSAQDVDFGGEAREVLECEYKGEKIEIGFNSVYIVDMLTHLDSEKVVFKFSAPTRAGIVVPATVSEEEDVLMLVMPVRLVV